MNWKATLLAAAFGATIFLIGAEPAQAQSSCFDRIRREEWKLQREVRRHGYFSRQAQHRRSKIDRLRARCGFYGFRDGRWEQWRWKHRRWDDWRWRVPPRPRRWR